MKIKQTSLKLKNQNNKISNKKRINKIFTVEDLQILSVDGVLVDLNQEEGRLLFYNNSPSVKVKINGKNSLYQINKCLVELRMPKTTFLYIANTIAKKIFTYSAKQKQNLLQTKEGNDLHLPMFA